MFRFLLIVVIVLTAALAVVVVALIGSLLWRLATGSRSTSRTSAPRPSAPRPSAPRPDTSHAGTVDPGVARSDERGKEAERRTAAILDRLPSHEYRVYHELFPDKNRSGSLAEVDHVVVSRFGVFVVETKGYYGDVHVAPEAKEWLIDQEREVVNRRSPLLQNKMHVDAITYTLGLRRRGWIRSVVCFPNHDTRLRGVPVDNVVTGDRLIEHIVKFRQVVLDAEGVGQITTVLDQVDAETPERSARHKRQVGYGSDLFEP